MSFRAQKPRAQKFGATVAAAAFATLAIASPAVAQRDIGEAAAVSAVSEPATAAPAPLAARPGGGRFDLETPVSGGQPRYVVRARQFHAFNESGFDWAGSDEVYGVWASGPTLAGTKVFEDVDTGDTRSFKRGQDCIYPINTTGYLDGRSGDTWGCIGEGAPGPIDFHITLWEADMGFMLPSCFDGGIGPEPDCEDDLLGSLVVSLSEDELSSALPNVGDTMVEYQLMSNCEPGTYCASSPLSGVYFIRYEVLRVADGEDMSDVVKG